MLGYGPSFREALHESIGPVSSRPAPKSRWRLGPAIGCGLGLLILATGGRAATFTVGSVGGCTHAGLQAALDAAAANGSGYDEIRLSQDQVGNFSIVAHSVGIVGGFSDCADTTPSGGTIVSGPGSGRVLDIAGGTSSFRTVELLHLEITGGHAAYGGGLWIGLKALVYLEDTAVSGNVATESGGGIGIQGDGGAVLTLDQGSSVMSNSAANVATGKGGGIYCYESVPSSGVIGLLDAFIYDNEAGTDGGGLYLSGCDLTSYSGGALRGIVGNRASRGGGVYAKSGAQLRFYGDTQHPATLDGNTVSPSGVPGYPYGSAVRIEGAGTQLELHNSWVVGNLGADAIGARDAAAVVIDRTLGADCHDRDRCSRLANNSVGVLAIFDTSLTLRETYVEENTDGGSAGQGGLVILYAGSRPVEIEGNVFARSQLSGTRPRIISAASGQIRIAYSTFIDNLTNATGWTQYVLGLDVAAGSSHDLTFVGNLVAETAGVLVDTYDSPAMWDQYNERFDCLVVHDSASLPPGATAVQVWTDPNLFFANRAGHDYHLSAGSPAIDFCDTLYYTPELEIDHQARGFDDPSLADLLGPYDLGADERQPDFLYDTFETGDVQRWSASSP